MRISQRGARAPLIQKPDGETTSLWWEAKPSLLAEAVFETAVWLADKQRRRLAANLHHLRVYSNRVASSLAGSAFTEGVSGGERIKLNATKSAIDAACAQIATNQPAIMHLTTGGSREQRERARRLDKYVMGWFHTLQLYVVWLGVFLDACIDGLGVLKFLAKPGGRIGCERVRSDCIFVDDNECRALTPTTPPRFLFEMRAVPRSVLLAQPAFKKFAEKIKLAEWIEDAHPAYPFVDDPVTVIEAWKLSTQGAPGRHVMTVSNQVLLDESWPDDKFPFAFFRWNDAPTGFYGIGAVEEVLPVQIELNILAQKLQRLMHFATSVIFKQRGSKMQPFTNQDWAVYEYEGSNPPQTLNMQAASAEYYNQIDRLYRIVYEILGVSQMSATGTKPAGLYSGDAIRLFHDVATSRFKHTEQRASQFFLDCAEQIELRAVEAKRRGYGSAKVLGMGDKDLELLDWDKVAMPHDMFVRRIRPISIIPTEPAGKVELLKALAPIAPQMTPYLLGSLSGIPDLEAAVSKANAGEEYAEDIVSAIVERGDFEPPSPGADLEAIRRIAQAEELNAKKNGLEPARAQLLRRLLIIVDQMQAQQQAQAMMAMGAQAGGPGMMGQPGGAAPAGGPGLAQLAQGMGQPSPIGLTPPGASLPGLGGQ